MAPEEGLRTKVVGTRLFEDDMDNITYEEPDDESTDKIDDQEEVRYWLRQSPKELGVIEEFKSDLRSIARKITRPLAKRVVWAGNNFIRLGYSRYTLIFFLIFVFITIYFGTLIHESLHIVAASFVNEIPIGIRLNDALYSQVGSALSMATGGFVQNAVMDSNNPGSALILGTGNPLHIAFIGIFPNVILFMLGFTWLRKGLNETKPGYFGAGLVFTCSNLEIFIPTLHTDITSTVEYIASIIGLTGNDIGAVTILIATTVFGSGYMLSILYDRWQKRLVERHNEMYPFDRPDGAIAIA